MAYRRGSTEGFRATENHRPRVMITWDEDILDAINEIAEEHNSSFSSIVNRMMRKHLLRHKKFRQKPNRWQLVLSCER